MMKVILGGHLGADVETRYTEKGKKVSTIRVAVNTRRAGKDETVWWRVTMWGDEFDWILPYLKKGSGVIVMGDFSRSEIYTDRDGKPQMSLEVTAKSVEFSPFGRDKMGPDGQMTGQGAGQIAGQGAGQAARPYAAQQSANPPSFAASQAPAPSYAASQQHSAPSPYSQRDPAPPYGQEDRPPAYSASYVIPPSSAPAAPGSTQAHADQPQGEYPPSKEDVPF